MSEFGDLIPEFVEESMEHLKNIEEDIIIIEQGSADNELINRVFRAVHSIKGGSSFLGLKNIEKLSHKMEDIFNLVRNNEMVFTSDISSAVLKAIDKLKDMLDDSEESDAYDIKENLKELKKCLEAQPSTKVETSPREESEDSSAMALDKKTLESLKKQGKHVYLIQFELLDETLGGKTPLDFFAEIEKTGQILARNVDMELVLKDESFTGEGIPMSILYASVLEQDLVAHVFGVDESKVKSINANSMSELQVIEDVLNKDQERKKGQSPDVDSYLSKKPEVSARDISAVRKSSDGDDNEDNEDEDRDDSDGAVSRPRRPALGKDVEVAPGEDGEGEYEEEEEEEDLDIIRDVNEFLTFLVDAEEYGIGITQVHEIVTLHAITPVPNAENYTKGIINLRGDIIPVFDFRLKLKFDERPYDQKTIILIVMIGGKKVGVIVDRVSEVIQFTRKEITEAPQMQQIPPNYVIGIGQKEGKFIILLKLKEIFKIDDAA